jgi:hypothetical protein
MPGGVCYVNWWELLREALASAERLKEGLIRGKQLFEKSCTKKRLDLL